jgi:mycofactocin precursor
MRSEESLTTSEEQEAREAEAWPEDGIEELLVEEVSIDGMCGVY